MLSGRTLLGEAVLVAAAFALAESCTTWLVAVWTGSLPLAVWAAATEVLIYPRTYGYPKVLLYSVAPILMLAYARAPTRARRWGLAAITVIAFLFRHDHGLFIGLGSALVVCMTDRAQSWRIAAGRLGELALAAALIAAPYAVYVSTSVGIANHVRSTLEFSVEQAQHNPPGLPHLDPALSASSRRFVGHCDGQRSTIPAIDTALTLAARGESTLDE